MKKKSTTNNYAVTPVISVLLITAAIVTASGIVWFGIYSNITADPELDANVDFENINDTHVEIKIEHLKNTNSLEIYYYSNSNFQSSASQVGGSTSLAPGTTIVHNHGSGGAYRIIGYQGDSTQTLENVIIE